MCASCAGVMAGRQRKGCVVDPHCKMCVLYGRRTGTAVPKVHHTHAPRGTYPMEATFEVSVKLSGWLNALAP